MVVAEALGLSIPEIRFLDRRIWNPMETVLTFNSTQRLITVGDLYDLLCECGFPLIGDLL